MLDVSLLLYIASEQAAGTVSFQGTSFASSSLVRTNRFYRKCGYRKTGKDIEFVYYKNAKMGDILYNL